MTLNLAAVGPVGSMSCCSILGRSSGLWIAFTNSALTRLSTGAGMPAGANTPCQVVTTNPGMPDSSIVRTSGSDAMRLWPVTASARRRPSLTWGTAVSTAPIRNCTRPAMVSSSDGAVPL